MRALLVLLLLTGTAHADLPWYRGFYTRVGVRDSFGVQDSFHAWAAFSFGLGYRYERAWWGVDGSVLNMQYDPEEGLHTPVRIVPYVTWRNLWAGAGLSYGWIKGTVYEPLPKRRGYGVQSELVVGIEAPRALLVRLFVQGTLTAPLYHLYEPQYHSHDSSLYVYALEGAVGIRF